MAGLGIAIVVGILNTPAIRAQDAIDRQTGAGGKMAFDVASVKPAKGVAVPSNFPIDPSDDYGPTNGRLSADGTLVNYLEFAYKVWGNEVQSREFSHLPKWVNTDRYSIDARATGEPTKDQMRLMLQSLLADRFRLAAHLETREVPVFELRLAKPGKPGPKLIPHADAPPCDQAGPSPVKDFPGFHFGCHMFSAIDANGTTIIMGSRDVRIETMAGIFSEAFAGPLAFGRPLIDKTGLTGTFDVTLEWARERRTPAGSDAPLASEPIGPTLVEAMRDQLGLKLESAKASIPILVIDNVERPSEN